MNILDHSHRLLTLALLAALSVVVPSAQGAILEEFTFSEPNGTPLDSVDNTGVDAHPIAIGGAAWDPSAVNSGSFHITKSATTLATGFFDVDNITDELGGKVWLVAEMAGWNYSLTESALDGIIRFGFLDNDNDPPSGSTVTAQMQINRTASGSLELVGTAIGTGFSNISTGLTLPATQTDPFTMVLELNKDDNEYSIFYKDGAEDYVLGGTGNLGASTLNAGDRDGNSVRFGATGDFNDVGEFWDINRIYLTDVSPVPPVDKLLLEVNTVNGELTIVNDTGSSFDINWYRITSDDDSLEFDNWDSLSDQAYDAIDGPIDGDLTVGNGIGETWDEAGGSDDGVFSESFLQGGSVFDPTDEISLGLQSFKVPGGDIESLIFEYRDRVTGGVFTGRVEPFTPTGLMGDYNGNNVIDAADYTVWRDALTAGSTSLLNDPTPGVVNESDFTYWRSHFGESLGSGAGSASTAIPEPGSLLLALCAGLAVCVMNVRRRGR